MGIIGISRYTDARGGTIIPWQPRAIRGHPCHGSSGSKLGIKEGHRVAVVGAPHGFALGALPAGTHLQRNLAGKAPLDVLVVFVTRRTDLVTRIATCRPRMQPAAGLWIAWPKRAWGMATDVTEDTVREVALPTGLVDSKVCAIDDTWSGLRLVIRRELRT